MTRREFVIQNYGENAANHDGAFGGIRGCPGHYKKLVEADKSITSASNYGVCLRMGESVSDRVCTNCWNQEIPGTEKTRPHGFRLEKVEKIVKDADLSIKEAIDRAVCDCDTCAHQDLCQFECQFRGMTKEMYQHCIEETARYNIPELGIQMRPLHCKRYEPSRTIEELNREVFYLKAQHLNDEMVRRILDIDHKENK